MTTYWRPGGPKPDRRLSRMVPRIRTKTPNSWNSSYHSNNNPVMAGRHPRRNPPRLPLLPRLKGTKARNNPIHYFRSNILLCIFLKILSQKPRPNPTDLLHLTATRHPTTEPILCAAPKHGRPPSLGCHSYLSSPQTNLRKQFRGNHRPNLNQRTRTIFYIFTT